MPKKTSIVFILFICGGNYGGGNGEKVNEKTTSGNFKMVQFGTRSFGGSASSGMKAMSFSPQIMHTGRVT